MDAEEELVRPVLGLVDYAIFCGMLLVSSGIGFWFRDSGGSPEEYLLAGKDMSVWPVSFSLMASFLSAVTVIGVPAEVYRFGVHLAYLNIGYSLGMVITGFLTLPVYFELQVGTAYEYLERRFGKLTRTLTSTGFVLQMILYMSVVLYAPALALSAVTNMSIWVAVVSMGVVCTFYCTLGGMKAVLWTDVFQVLLMFLGMFAVLFKAVADIGVREIYETAKEGGRLAPPGWSLDPTERYTYWDIMAQGVTLSMIAFGGNQVQVQRLLTVKNISRARLALYLSIPMGVSFHLLNCLVGVVIYAHYADCDPMTAPDTPIQSADQLLPYYMMDVLGAYPGLPGLCICGVFSASLSTISSAVNSLTAVTMQDLVRPHTAGLSSAKAAFGAKAITLFFGFLCVALAFLVASFGNLIQGSLTIFGMVGAPVLGVFILGMTTTRANEKGAIVGLVGGVAVSAWISFGAASNAPPPHFLPVSIQGCNSTSLDSNSSSSLNSNSTLLQVNEEDIFFLYRVSYMWFSMLGLIATVLIGYSASLAVNALEGATGEVPWELMSPMAKRFMKKEGNMQLGKRTELCTMNGTQTKNGAPGVQNGDIKTEDRKGDSKGKETQGSERQGNERQESEKQENEREEKEKQKNEREESEKQKNEREESEKQKNEREESEKQENEREESEKQKNEREESEKQENETEESEKQENESKKQENEKQENEKQESEKQESERL